MAEPDRTLTREPCLKFIADPCGSSKCANCGKRRAEHRPRAPDQTNAEVSDERDAIFAVLRDFRMPNMIDNDDSGAAFPLVDLCSNPGTSIETGESVLRDLADEIAYALTRRSVTSQASEGMAVAWTGPKQLAYLAANPMSTVVVWGAQRGEESSIGLYASPSLRVERLETLLTQALHVLDQPEIYTIWPVSALRMEITQALQGGHS